DVFSQSRIGAYLGIAGRLIRRDAAGEFRGQHFSIFGRETMNALPVHLQQPSEHGLSGVWIFLAKEFFQAKLVFILYEYVEHGLPRARRKMIGRRLLESVKMLDLLGHFAGARIA